MTYLALSLWLLGSVGMWIELADDYTPPSWSDRAQLVLFSAAWPLVMLWALCGWVRGK